MHISVRKKHNLHIAIWTLDIPVQHVQKQDNALFKVPFKLCIIYIEKKTSSGEFFDPVSIMAC